MRRHLLIMATSLGAGSVAAQTVDAPEITNEPLDPALAETVADALPESSNVDKNFLNPSYDPTVRVSEDAQVFVTFVDEGAGYQNSLGYFSYADGALDGLTKADVDADADGIVSLHEAEAVGVDIGWVFPDATRADGRLSPGDTVTLGDGTIFSSGTNIGFFLVQNGWDGGGVDGWTNDQSPQTFYTLDFLNPEASGDLTSADSGVGSTRHVAMLFEDTSREQIIMGFEDLNRVDRYANDYNYASDEDFNDAVFTIRSNPVEAIQSSEIATAPGPVAGSTIAGLLVVAFMRLRRRREAST
jgi:hypothetical protein